MPAATTAVRATTRSPGDTTRGVGSPGAGGRLGATGLTTGTSAWTRRMITAPGAGSGAGSNALAPTPTGGASGPGPLARVGAADTSQHSSNTVMITASDSVIHRERGRPRSRAMATAPVHRSRRSSDRQRNGNTSTFLLKIDRTA